MYENLKQFVEQFANLSREEWEAVMPLIEIRKLRKNDYFVKEGEIARYISFTQSGYLRVYYNHDGD